MSEPYDPYVPRDPGSSNGGSGGSKPGDSNDSNQDGPEGRKPTAADDVRERIAKVTGIMEENIKRVSERGENLDSLRDKTNNLATSAQGFRQGANRVRKNMWWKDMKMRIIIGTAITVILIIIIVSVVKATQGHN